MNSARGTKSALKLTSIYSKKDSQQTIIEPVYAPPFRRYDGMWQFADGVFFNPGFGRGMYYWDSQQPVGVYRGDGIQFGTFPRWKAENAGYVIDFGGVIPDIGSLGSIMYLISGGTVALDEFSFIRILATGQVEFEHRQSHPTQIGNVISTNAITEGAVHSVAGFVTASGTSGQIAVIVDGVETRTAFTYNDSVNTGFYTHLFTSSDAVGTGILDNVIVTGLGLTDIGGTDDRFYPFDDDPVATPNVFRDTGGQNLDGTWVNQSAGNHIQGNGAWIPVNNLRVETT